MLVLQNKGPFTLSTRVKGKKECCVSMHTIVEAGRCENKQMKIVCFFSFTCLKKGKKCSTKVY